MMTLRNLGDLHLMLFTLVYHFHLKRVLMGAFPITFQPGANHVLEADIKKVRMDENGFGSRQGKV